MLVKLCFPLHFIPLDPNECGSDRIRIRITDVIFFTLHGAHRALSYHLIYIPCYLVAWYRQCVNNRDSIKEIYPQGYILCKTLWWWLGRGYEKGEGLLKRSVWKLSDIYVPVKKIHIRLQTAKKNITHLRRQPFAGCLIRLSILISYYDKRLTDPHVSCCWNIFKHFFSKSCRRLTSIRWQLVSWILIRKLINIPAYLYHTVCPWGSYPFNIYSK